MDTEDKRIPAMLAKLELFKSKVVDGQIDGFLILATTNENDNMFMSEMHGTPEEVFISQLEIMKTLLVNSTISRIKENHGVLD